MPTNGLSIFSCTEIDAAYRKMPLSLFFTASLSNNTEIYDLDIPMFVSFLSF